MPRPEKIETVEFLHGEFVQDPDVIVVDFQGLDVGSATELRRRIRDHDAEFRVVKNTLALRAAEETAMEQVRDAFVGQTAIAYTSNDIVGLAKLLRDFHSEYEVPRFKAGVVDGETIGAEEFEALADLPPRDELVAQALYLMQYPVTGLVTALQGVVKNLAVVLDQIRQEKEKQEE